MIDNVYLNYVGDVGFGINFVFVKCICDVDLLFVIGLCFGEVMIGGYMLFDILKMCQMLIYVYQGVDEFGCVYVVDLLIVLGMFEIVVLLVVFELLEWFVWVGVVVDVYCVYCEWYVLLLMFGDVQFGDVMVQLCECLLYDVILINGVGNYVIWLYCYFVYWYYCLQFVLMSGVMGYGLLVVFVVKLLYLQCVVVVFVGDGCFMMVGNEFVIVM